MSLLSNWTVLPSPSMISPTLHTVRKSLMKLLGKTARRRSKLVALLQGGGKSAIIRGPAEAMLEIEVKYPVKDWEGIERALHGWKASFEELREDEDQYFNSPDR